MLALAAVVYALGLGAASNYDEGVYLASLDALVHGQSLGSEVYASQPPGFYALLRGVSFLPGDGVDAIRGGFLAVALLGVGAAWAIGRRIAGTWGAVGAGALLAVVAPYPVQAPRVQADTASVAIALAALAVLIYAKRNPWLGVAAGVLAGAAVSVKLLALPVAAPLAVLLVARRSWRLTGAVAAGAAAVWAVLAVAHVGAWSELWRSIVTDHRSARGLGPSLADNVERVLLHPLDWKTPAALLVVTGLVAAAVFLRRVETLALGFWIVASALFLVVQQPLLDHHFVLLAATLAVPAGAGLGAAVARVSHPAQIVVAAVLGVALLGAFVQEGRRLARQPAEPAVVKRAAADLRRAASSAEFVGTDLPIVAYLADRRLPGTLVDTSFVRLGTGSLTDEKILVELERNNVRVVAVGREFADRPGLLAALQKHYPAERELGGITIYLSP